MKKLENKKIVCIGIFLGIMVIFGNIFAGSDVPRYINYQGRLTDASGNPVNGTVKMEFVIYISPTSFDLEDILWTEVHPEVSVVDGSFKIKLGVTNEIDPRWFRENTDLYLGISVENNNEMSPRAIFSSVGYVFKAQYSAVADRVISGKTPITLSSYADIDENVPENHYFHLDEEAESIFLYLWGEKFSIQFYTELGDHSHTIESPSVLSSSVNLNHKHKHHGCSDWGGCTGAWYNSEYALGIHSHTVDIPQFDSGLTGVNAGPISTMQKTYLNNMQVDLNGVDITSNLLAQTTMTEFGDSTAEHPFNNENGSGKLILTGMTKIGQNKLSFKIPIGNGGGGIRYILYINQ